MSHQIAGQIPVNNYGPLWSLINLSFLTRTSASVKAGKPPALQAEYVGVMRVFSQSCSATRERLTFAIIEYI